jgi:hypothetical protein
MYFRLVVVAVGLASGCATSRSLEPVDQQVTVPDAVTVRFRQMRRGHLGLEVANLSPRRLVVYRDAVMLADGRDERPRERGFVRDIVRLSPGRHRPVRVRYRLDDLAVGQPVELRFPTAITVDNQPVEVPPLRFVVR